MGLALLLLGIISLVPKTMIEIVADDDRVGDIVKVVRDVAKTGQIGDGRIFVFPIDVPRQEWFHGYRID